MSLTSCHVHFSPQSERIVYLSSSLLKSLKLAGKKSVHLKLGKQTITAAIRTINRQGSHLYLSAGVRNSIRVPKAGTISLLQDEDNEVQIGPLIGVLTDSGLGSTGSPFGSRTGYIRQLLRMGERKAYFFAFTPRDIDWQQEKVNGYFLNSQGGWYRKTVSLPDVVYNRLPSRRAETTSTITSLRERFIRKQIPFFNWSFFNKSDVYKLLDQDVEALVHMPESANNPRPEKIKEMLEKHQFIYYKPTAGSLGIGIYRLTYNPKRGYFARYRRNNTNVLLRFTSFNSLMRMLQARHGSSGLERYVCQQGVRLIEIDGCPIDFRFHMHKNGDNEWVPVGIGAKKAGRGSVTTHIKNGGSLLTPKQALSKTFGDQDEEILEKAKRVSVKLSEAIERNFPHTLGELGLDLGIDKDGEVWMFEANAKPGRSIFSHPALRSEGRASLSHILDHCMYLSNFRRGND